MNVLVDTCVWSLALRRQKQPEDSSTADWVTELKQLIQEGRAVMTGVVRQEMLSGIRHSEQFSRLRDVLRSFPDLEVTSEDHEQAAELFNQCRVKGIQGSNTDFLICALSQRHQLPILTMDQDFEGYQGVFPLVLVGPR